MFAFTISHLAVIIYRCLGYEVCFYYTSATQAPSLCCRAAVGAVERGRRLHIGWKTHRELSGDGVKADVDGVLKVRGGGDLRPVLIPVLLPAPCGSKVKSSQYIPGKTNAMLKSKIAQIVGRSPFSGANMEMILFLGFFSSGTDGSGREL